MVSEKTTSIMRYSKLNSIEAKYRDDVALLWLTTCGSLPVNCI